MKDNKRGGFRVGAGRKSGSGCFGESTKVIRVPTSRVTEINKYIRRPQAGNTDIVMLPHPTPQKIQLKLFDHKVPA